jgi:hypothetical protein
MPQRKRESNDPRRTYVEESELAVPSIVDPTPLCFLEPVPLVVALHSAPGLPSKELARSWTAAPIGPWVGEGGFFLSALGR